jgi:cell wall-associated NlpC family hydrolase
VIALAEQQLGARWQYAAIGPRRFDCSGLIYFAFREAGLLDRIGSRRQGATRYVNWFARQGLRSDGDITQAQPGDVLIWGHGSHAGIYIGDGWAISALVNPYGVRIHRWDRLNKRLTDVLHVQLSREAPAA